MNADITYLEDAEIYERVLRDLVPKASQSVWIATANVKDCRIEINRSFRSIVRMLEGLCARGVEVRLLHSGVPSEPYLHELRESDLTSEELFTMRRCPRVHFKAVVVDCRHMYFGSANLTGAGMGAKGANRRNFEAAFVTSNAFLIHQITNKFERIWGGAACEKCDRKGLCAVPLEEPDLGS